MIREESWRTHEVCSSYELVWVSHCRKEVVSTPTRERQEPWKSKIRRGYLVCSLQYSYLPDEPKVVEAQVAVQSRPKRYGVCMRDWGWTGQADSRLRKKPKPPQKIDEVQVQDDSTMVMTS